MNTTPANATPLSEFKLNGLTWNHYSSGIRTYNFVDVYQCTLYFSSQDKPKKDQLTAVIKNIEYPIAIRIKILTSMLPDKMPEFWRETIEGEVTGKAFSRFQKGFSNLNEEDILVFTYLSGKGTRLYLNDKLLFNDPGPGLMQGLLEQWIGSQPISEDLKQALIAE